MRIGVMEYWSGGVMGRGWRMERLLTLTDFEMHVIDKRLA